MAQILRNNILIGTAAIKDLVVSDNSKTQHAVKFVRTVDLFENIDISYDTFKEFEYGDVVIDNVLYGDIPASGGSVLPQITYHQRKIYKGHSGLRYMQDVQGSFVALKPQYNYVGEYVAGMFVKYNDVVTYQGKYYRCINRTGTSNIPSLETNYREVGGPDTIADMGEWYSGIYVGYNQTVSKDNQIFKCVNDTGSFECPIEAGEVHPDFVQIQEYISEGATITFSGKFVNSNGEVIFNTSLGNRLKPRSVIDTVTVTVSLNGKTDTKTVKVYQSANTIVATNYSIPVFTNTFSYDVFGAESLHLLNVFGAVGAESVVPSIAPKYKQTRTIKFSSGAAQKTIISTGGVLNFGVSDPQKNFTLMDASTGAISTKNRVVPGKVSGNVSVRVTLNGQTSSTQTIQICQEGVQRWRNGNVYTPQDIVSMGLNANGKDRLFIPLTETSNPPLYIFRSLNNDALKFSGSNTDGYILTGETNTASYTELI